MKEAISIIGAGIGGLTTALALQQRGLQVTVYEASAEIKPVGAGIVLASNAMQVFKNLRIHHKIEKAGHKVSRMKITDAHLNPLSVVDLTDYEKKYGVYNTAIHRGELQKILANELGYENIRLGKRLANIEKAANFTLTFEDHSTVESKIVIGADGIKSIVRNQLFGKSTIRNTNQLCWRGLCQMDLSKQYEHEFNEAWGKGKRFGFGKISSNKVYWYALTNLNKPNIAEVNLAQLFCEFHPDILNIISATKSENIFVSDIIDLKPINKWQSENLCLIGDAAHATTPNLGQGACQAIEDAFVLAKLLDNGLAIENTFEAYEKLRRKKAHKIVTTSWTLGKIAHWSNPFLVSLRNISLRITPDSVNKKLMNQIFKLN